MSKSEPSSIGELQSERAHDSVSGMFDRIAPRYDLLNRLLSLRRDMAWRRRLARHLPEREGLRVLDLATGTGDVLVALCGTGRVGSAVGVDAAGGMLALGRRKVAACGLDERVRMVRGDAA
ncbi:MAG: class I SAM-dependent methyltransferase, partial [Candidatus Hydrogenedentes bacterium]|nr:class I SAM-dependent methyltransferase [Candidatus Hydrogenedentota bacterium]